MPGVLAIKYSFSIYLLQIFVVIFFACVLHWNLHTGKWHVGGMTLQENMKIQGGPKKVSHYQMIKKSY